jgi:hypothetical protein
MSVNAASAHHKQAFSVQTKSRSALELPTIQTGLTLKLNFPFIDRQP